MRILFVIAIVGLLVGCSFKKRIDKELITVDTIWLDSIIKSSDTFYTKAYHRNDFVTAAYFVNKKDSSICQVMKDSADVIRQVIISKKNTRVFYAGYYANGQLKAKYSLDSFGQYNGLSKEYYENGAVQSEGNYNSGIKNGDWKNYDSTGVLLSTETLSIPIILERKDLLGCAQTGTGKTAAFAIPVLQILYAEKQAGPKKISTLILTPTRELAIQIGESFAAYGKYTGLKHTVIFGGVSQMHQANAIRAGIDILIATPGRLLDLISQGIVGLAQIKIFILDEADRMLDMGFIHDVKRVITKLPAKRQTLFFSATMPPEIQTLANVLLTNPSKVEVTPASSTVDRIDQTLYYVDKLNKAPLLLDLIKQKKMETVLVFTRTKHGADKVVIMLNKAGITAAAIHGNKSQNARQNALNNFKNGTINVLVATDIAARGIDIDELRYVINYELPDVPETYVHRIGRTGRAGLSGEAMSFCEAEEKDLLKDIQKVIAKNIPVFDAHPYPMQIMTAPPMVRGGGARPAFKKRTFNNAGGDRGGRSNSNNNQRSTSYR
ncbi:MAG: DEAD/DEAH box helicase [Sphingobacteriales bacterium]|nr:DEAD/DEAH box helicase [Sphingobacteriales bacterium]